MHDDRTLVEGRLDRVLAHRLRPAALRTVATLDVEAWHVDGGQGEPVPPAHALPGPGRGPDVDFRPFAVGEPWGPAWGTTWFRLTGTVPPGCEGRRVELVVDLGWEDHSPGFQAEGLVYRPDGSVVKGLNPRNTWVPVGGEEIDLYVEAAANPLVLPPDPFRPTPLGEKSTAGTAPLYRLARADVCVVEEDVWELVQDLEVLDGMARELALGDPRRHEVVRALERALDALDLGDVAGTAAAARAELVEVTSRPAVPSAHRISAVGHAHIDSAWLWPVRETVRKVARTAANVVNLLDSDPDLVFAMSSAQQFAWIEEHRPEVFARVREHVASGRFVPVGGMWVESDTVMPGSEALARQLVHGKRYFLDRFGIETREVWLPDSFGYSPALPQLVHLSGSRWFLTQKISWNQVNPFPHHTFRWEGIDGSRVFTHFPPIDTYSAELSGSQLAHASRNFRDKGRATRSLAPFGWGDGGGGPTREMLARARRTADLEGSPRVVVESPTAFFEAAEAEYPDAPVWAGELYLELHRGTLTSQVDTKQGNRRGEHLLFQAELWSATAAARGLVEYPYDDLDALWKQHLLLQFHDILPGTSIGWVHREAAAQYAAMRERLTAIVDRATGALAGAAPGPVVFNAAPHARAGVPPLGAGPASDAGTVDVTSTPGGGTVLDNGLLRVEVDADGLVAGLRDLVADREVLPPGARGNLLQVHPDLPVMWDAWDVDRYYRNVVTDLDAAERVEVRAEPDGAATVRTHRAFGASTAVQDVTLRPGERRLDLRTEVDWQERERLLKVALPVDVHALDAAFETQFGHHRRAVHENTSWDAMRFEVAAHRFVHVGEPGYGVAVVNRDTYGHDVRREARDGGGTTTTVRLSLVRGPQFPQPDTDRGRHEFAYAVAPGAEIADAVREGWGLNVPLRTMTGAASSAGSPTAPVVVEPLARVLTGSAVLSAVKLADDRSGDVVVRLHEAEGRRGPARLALPAGPVQECDLLERPLAERSALVGPRAGDEVDLVLRPFQVVTLRVGGGTP
ncbi:alpha-mannosidase [Cellulomonas triticagri]|uniref:Alpha-mannosidase n=1 Tax=Cellulomonas triticagri TaxID=2483352 RepID=A0A3M2JAB8_9CELL|nr:glycoside hydrolase family 38 C-terminal domain-containing protein [Cellulomonas triticagri]RMI08750.1 alpha-mannosidase [Cellulomonas triticagri]